MDLLFGGLGSWYELVCLSLPPTGFLPDYQLWLGLKLLHQRSTRKSSSRSVPTAHLAVYAFPMTPLVAISTDNLAAVSCPSPITIVASRALTKSSLNSSSFVKRLRRRRLVTSHFADDCAHIACCCLKRSESIDVSSALHSSIRVLEMGDLGIVCSVKG